MASERPRRKGRIGCYVCGGSTEVIVQVWMREILDERDKGGQREARSLKSISVSFCREHGEEFYGRHTADVPVCVERPRERPDMAHARTLSINSGWPVDPPEESRR